MERSVMTQRVAILLLTFLCFVSLPNKGKEAQEIRRFMILWLR